MSKTFYFKPLVVSGGGEASHTFWIIYCHKLTTSLLPPLLAMPTLFNFLLFLENTGELAENNHKYLCIILQEDNALLLMFTRLWTHNWCFQSWEKGWIKGKFDTKCHWRPFILFTFSATQVSYHSGLALGRQYKMRAKWSFSFDRKHHIFVCTHTSHTLWVS